MPAGSRAVIIGHSNNYRARRGTKTRSKEVAKQAVIHSI